MISIDSVRVWDACSDSLIAFDPSNQAGEDSLAYIVENDVIQACLLERLKQFNIELRLNSRVKKFEYNPNSIRVQLQDEKVNLQTGLLVSLFFLFCTETNGTNGFRLDCS